MRSIGHNSEASVEVPGSNPFENDILLWTVIASTSQTYVENSLSRSKVEVALEVS
jgi:hypothetical protein